MDNFFRQDKVIDCQSNGSKPEFMKSHENGLCVIMVRFNENIKITRVIRRSMERERIRADDHIFNLLCVE